VTGPNITAQIAAELSIILKRLDADEELLAIIGDWRDTLGNALQCPARLC
jgi:hypothetical protein